MIAENFDDLFADIDINKLPTLPQILLLFLDASHTEVIDFDELSRLIKRDASLTTRIVSAASSAYYGGQGSVQPFERTLVMLGMQTIKTIAITASVQQFFSRFEGTGVQQQKIIWRESLTCAQLASRLAQLMGYVNHDEAYLAGMIHNIGSLIFANNYLEQYAELRASTNSDVELLALETEHFGGNRYQAAAWMVSSWGDDSLISDAVLYQGEEPQAVHSAHQLVKILSVASRLSKTQDDAIAEGLAAAVELFDLDHDLITDLLDKIQNEVVDIAASMEIDLGDDSTDLSTVDEEKQIELAGRVRDIGLLDGVRQELFGREGELAVKQSIVKSLRILFSSRGCLFFKPAPQKGVLLGDPLGKGDDYLSHIEVVLEPEASLLARSFLEKQVCHSQSVDSAAPISVVDRQLMKLLDGKAIVCLPLVVDQQSFGVLVVGIDAKTAAILDQQLHLWKMFANEASCSLLTQRKQAQQLQEQREEDGEYIQAKAREIVHEVNNPLSIVKNYVHILSSRLTSEEGISEELQVIREELDRAGNILLRLPGIADQQSVAEGVRRVDVNKQIMDLLKLFRSSLLATNGVEVVADLDHSMVEIETSPSAIKQILTNLIKNAAEALPPSGCITVETQALVNLNGRNYVEIVIADNGPGIAAEVQEKLFTPVETTKGGSHSGLGLSIVKHLVDELDGSISCRSSAKNGTRFEILIPRITEEG